MRAPAPFLLATLALAGCNAAPKGPSVHEQEAARATQVDRLKGWDRMFQPDVAHGAANQLGLHPTDYAAAAGGFESKGGPVTISNSFARAPNQVAYTASGKAAGTIDAFAFDLTLSDPEVDAKARERFANLVRDFVFQSKIDAKPIMAAMTTGTPAKGDLAGAPYEIARAADARGVDHLTVTFTRTGASAPANSKTQG